MLALVVVHSAGQLEASQCSNSNWSGVFAGRGRHAVIPLSPNLWAYARQAVPCSFTLGDLYRVWKRAAEKAGAQELRLRDPRHVFGQWLVNAGVAQSVVQVG